MKILHFSDIHTGGHTGSFQSFFDKRIIGTLNYKLRRQRHVKWDRLERAIEIIKEEKPDIVINTGDITSVSEVGEFQEALERLREITKNKNFTFLNVPGNHDFYVNNDELLNCRNETYNTLNRNLFPLQDFPCKHETEKAVFILVDESRPNSGTNSSGCFKKGDFEAVAQWAEEAAPKPVILVGHYPLRNKLGHPLSKRRALENAELLIGLLEKGKITISLCGHIHAAFSREEQSGSREICAGSLTIGGRMNKLVFDEASNSFSQSWIEIN